MADNFSFDDLTDEQKARVRSATTADELKALANEDGLELNDEMLDSIAGGAHCPSYGCYRYYHCRRDACDGFNPYCGNYIIW